MDSYYPIKHLAFSAPLRDDGGWGQVTVEESHWQSGLFGLFVFKQLCQSSTKTKPKGGAISLHEF